MSLRPDRFQQIAGRYPHLQVGVIGDFCLDRYLEIDPARAETSIETGLPVHNVTAVRAQPGGAGTILNNLAALGLGRIRPVGFCGDDGEGYELQRALRARPGTDLAHFLPTPDRRTFTYCKPLRLERGRPPVELNRLDSKNWTPTPDAVQDRLIASLRAVAAEADALIVLDQVDVPETGVVTVRLLAALGEIVRQRPDLLVIADSRRGLRGYPPVTLKMNAAELAALAGTASAGGLEDVKAAAGRLAREHGRAVFVTLSERGMIGAGPEGPEIDHVPALPVRGPIDIVGAGDAVTANLAAALAAGAGRREAMEVASVAASLVIHQLGTTGTAGVREIAAQLGR